MTDEKRFCDDVVERVVPEKLLRLAAWEALPLSVRVADRLAEIAIIAGDLRVELAHRDAAAFRWIEPEIDCVIERVDHALGRLVS